MPPIQRVIYTTGQFLVQDDFRAEQDYHRRLRRLHSQCLHTPGVASGFDVSKKDDTSITVSPGLAIDATGAEIALGDPVTVSLTAQAAKEWLLLSAVYSELNVDAPGNKQNINGADTYIRKNEQPDFQFDQIASNTAVPPFDPSGLKIRLALLHIVGGKLVDITVNSSTRQLAGSRLDPGANLSAGTLKVSGDSSLAGTTSVTGKLSVKAPGGSLDVAGPSSFSGGVNMDNLFTQTVSIGSIGQQLVMGTTGAGGGRIFCQNSQPLALQESGGNVGINNSAPQGALHIGSPSSSNPDLFLTGNTAAGQDGLRLSYNRNLRIGVLDVRGGSLKLRGDAGASGDAGIERLSIDLASGAVSIPGTLTVGTNVATGMSVAGELSVGGALLYVRGAGGEQAYLGGDGGVYDPDGPQGVVPNALDVQLGSTSAYVYTVSLYNRGSAKFMHLAADKLFGTKVGYVVDQFVNATGERLSVGDVVVLGSNQASLFYGPNDVPVPEVDLTRQAYDTRVCGIVSDECPVGSPHRLNEGPDKSGAPKSRSRKAKSASEKAMAAQLVSVEERAAMGHGQVGHMATLGAFAHCKVDADIAEIEVGDLLTTSPTPGHAQKVLDRSQAIGAIIGKALAPLKKGKGRIPVMVTLQ